MRHRKTLVSLAAGASLVLGVLALSDTAYSDGDHGKRGLRFQADLSGAQEAVPPGGVDTDATGRVTASFNGGLTAVMVTLRVRNPSSDVMRAHFHCARPGMNGPIAFGIVDPGPCVFDGNKVRRCVLTNADFTGGDCTGPIGRPVNNIAALAFAMRDGLIYANVHTANFPGGEIRSQMLER